MGMLTTSSTYIQRPTACRAHASYIDIMPCNAMPTFDAVTYHEATMQMFPSISAHGQAYHYFYAVIVRTLATIVGIRIEILSVFSLLTRLKVAAHQASCLASCQAAWLSGWLVFWAADHMVFWLSGMSADLLFGPMGSSVAGCTGVWPNISLANHPLSGLDINQQGSERERERERERDIEREI